MPIVTKSCRRCSAKRKSSADRDKFTALSREYSELEPIIERHRRLAALRAQIADAEALLKDDDAEMRELASDDLANLRNSIEAVELEIKALLRAERPAR